MWGADLVSLYWVECGFTQVRVWAWEADVCARQGVWSTSFGIACGDFSVPSLLASKHALVLVTARFSLFLSPKLALSHLIESGLLKTMVRQVGRSSEGHGICSGCVPILQVLSYCICRTVLKVRCHLPSLHTALWVTAWARETFTHLDFLFFILFWQEMHAAEEDPHSNCVRMTENQQNCSSVWLHSDQREKGNRCSQLRF